MHGMRRDDANNNGVGLGVGQTDSDNAEEVVRAGGGPSNRGALPLRQLLEDCVFVGTGFCCSALGETRECCSGSSRSARKRKRLNKGRGLGDHGGKGEGIWEIGTNFLCPKERGVRDFLRPKDRG